MRTLKFVLIAITLLPIGIAPSRVEAATTWEKCSNMDSSDPLTVSEYDLDYICAAQYSDEPNEISFYLYFRTIIRSTQFNNSYGSWAAVTIDTDFNGEYDLYIRTSNQTLLYDNKAVAGRAVKNGQTMSCPVDVWTNLGASAKWIGLSVKKDCAGLSGIGLNLMGYADSEYFYDDGYDYAPTSAFYVSPPSNATITTTTIPQTTTTTAPATTTTTTTTIPKVQIPNAPTSVSISQTSANSLRVTWLDNSSNEDGFLIQRNDTPVPAGTPISSWPYKSAANSPSFDATNLTPNRQYCYAISSYNSAGSSAFTESSCFNLVATTTSTVTQSTAPAQSLSCDATRVSFTKNAAQIVVDTGVANAGKTMTFEVFKAGKWTKIGTGRTSGQGASAFTAPIKIVGKKGPMPIRGTQGSRFICEGTLT